MARKTRSLIPFVTVSLLTVAGCGGGGEATTVGTCTIVDLGDGTSAIRCPDGSELVVKNGEKGDKGDKGDKGEKGDPGEKGADGKDGKDAEPTCTLTDNGDGTVELTCGDVSVVLGDECEEGFPCDVRFGRTASYDETTRRVLFQSTDCTWVRGNVYVLDYELAELPRALLRVTRIDGTLWIGRSHALEQVSLPRLETIGGDLSIDDNSALTTIADFPSLTKVKTLLIGDNESLASVGSFPKLSSVGTFAVLENDVLVTIGDFDELTEAGSLEFEDLALVENLGTFPKLAKVRDRLYVGYTDALERLPDFPALENVGHLHIVENANLSDIAGLSSLEVVEKDLRIANNPKLSNADIDELRDHLDVSGVKVVCGNDGEASCAPW